MTATSTHPKVDEEFAMRLTEPTDAERQELEASLLREGCRDALVVWKGKDVLLDGHTRLAICKKHGVKYRIKELALDDRQAALEWIDRNQLGRRNLTPDQRKMVMGRVYNRDKKAPHRPKGGQIDHLNGKTHDAVADRFGVAEKTARRAAKAAAEIDEHPALAAQVVKGKKKIREAVKEARQTVAEQFPFVNGQDWSERDRQTFGEIANAIGPETRDTLRDLFKRQSMLLIPADRGLAMIRRVGKMKPAERKEVKRLASSSDAPDRLKAIEIVFDTPPLPDTRLMPSSEAESATAKALKLWKRVIGHANDDYDARVRRRVTALEDWLTEAKADTKKYLEDN